MTKAERLAASLTEAQRRAIVGARGVTALSTIKSLFKKKLAETDRGLVVLTTLGLEVQSILRAKEKQHG